MKLHRFNYVYDYSQGTIIIASSPRVWILAVRLVLRFLGGFPLYQTRASWSIHAGAMSVLDTCTHSAEDAPNEAKIKWSNNDSVRFHWYIVIIRKRINSSTFRMTQFSIDNLALSACRCHCRCHRIVARVVVDIVVLQLPCNLIRIWLAQLPPRVETSWTNRRRLWRWWRNN